MSFNCLICSRIVESLMSQSFWLRLNSRIACSTVYSPPSFLLATTLSPNRIVTSLALRTRPHASVTLTVAVRVEATGFITFIGHSQKEKGLLKYSQLLSNITLGLSFTKKFSVRNVRERICSQPTSQLRFFVLKMTIASNLAN